MFYLPIPSKTFLVSYCFIVYIQTSFYPFLLLTVYNVYFSNDIGLLNLTAYIMCICDWHTIMLMPAYVLRQLHMYDWRTIMLMPAYVLRQLHMYDWRTIMLMPAYVLRQLHLYDWRTIMLMPAYVLRQLHMYD